MNYAFTCIWSCLMLWIMHLLAFETVLCYELCIYLHLKLSDAMNYAFTCLWNCLVLWIMHLLAFEAVWCYELCIYLPLKLSDVMNYAFTCLWSSLVQSVFSSLAFETLLCQVSVNQWYTKAPFYPEPFWLCNSSVKYCLRWASNKRPARERSIEWVTVLESRANASLMNRGTYNLCLLEVFQFIVCMPFVS
jgi:hypothetical protein